MDCNKYHRLVNTLPMDVDFGVVLPLACQSGFPYPLGSERCAQTPTVYKDHPNYGVQAQHLKSPE